ncbi:GDP-mannose 4,6-dehydratase [Patescibacteria group bacterium]|nr:GDP-mannose 4,6-dehydratase [Patescibacteria group bacterium]
MSQKVVVTGSCGFQGSHLVEALLKRGDEVVGLAIPSSESFNNYNKYLAKCVQYQQVWGSVNDKDIVDRVIRESDLVYHLAAKINVDESIYDFENFYRTNIMGTSNVLEACRKYEVPLMHISTCEVMGENDTALPMAEDRLLNPHSPYAASKCAADRMCYAYYKTHGLKVKIVRPFNLFGPRQKRRGAGALIPILFEKAINDQELTIFGSGEQDRDYLYIDDIVRAYLLIRDTDDFIGRVVHVGSGKPQKIIDIANKIINMVGKGHIAHKEARPGEVRTFTADNSFINQYGFEPEIDFDEGLCRYFAWRSGEKDD